MFGGPPGRTAELDLFAYNRGDGTFSKTFIYNNIHETSLDNQGIHVTLADMNGNGTQDIVWSNDFGIIGTLISPSK